MQAKLYWIPAPLPGRMAIMPRPRGGDWLEDETCSIAEAGVLVLVSCLTSWEVDELDLGEEPTLAGRAGIEFISFPILDRGVPTGVQRLNELTSALTERIAGGDGVARQCRAGIGRASLVAACVLVSSGIKLEAAFEEIAAARGMAVPDTPEQRAFVADFARSRADTRPEGLGQIS